MQTVLRFQPIERRGISAIGIHNSRGYTQENLPEHIDLSRSHLNKILVGPAVAEIPAAMKEAIAGVPVARKMADPSKDLVMAECLLSAFPANRSRLRGRFFVQTQPAPRPCFMGACLLVGPHSRPRFHSAALAALWTGAFSCLFEALS